MKPILALLLLVAIGAQAQQIRAPQPRCSKMEFAELQSLNAKQLQERYCAVRGSFYYFSAGRSLDRQAECQEELMRILRHKEYINMSNVCPE